jgi:hypothetical protein
MFVHYILFTLNTQKYTKELPRRSLKLLKEDRIQYETNNISIHAPFIHASLLVGSCSEMKIRLSVLYCSNGKQVVMIIFDGSRYCLL